MHATTKTHLCSDIDIDALAGSTFNDPWPWDEKPLAFLGTIAK